MVRQSIDVVEKKKILEEIDKGVSFEIIKKKIQS